MKMKKVLAALSIGLFFSILMTSMTDFMTDCGQIRENVLRLHILANSDTDEDQNLKLAVRDRILETTGSLFYNMDSTEDAKETALENLDLILEAAREEIASQGYDYTVNAEVCNMFFDTRIYDQFRLPAGRYDAVRITIGEAKGHNWWCVLYPPMCLPGAMPKEELEAVMEPGEADIIERPEKYEVKFAVVELWEKFKNLFER